MPLANELRPIDEKGWTAPGYCPSYIKTLGGWMKIRRNAGCCGALGLVCWSMTGVAAAQETPPANASLQEIVVTANKRGEQSLQDIPISISALSATDLQRSQAQGIQDFATSIPGLAVFDTGPNQKKLKIRGVSGSSESEPQETVGVYLDDVDITNPGGTNNENNTSPDLNLFDIDRIEVLKGPQGTLYGAGSMGGTIRFITKQPKLDQFEGEVQGRASDTRYGEPSYGGDFMLNAPLVNDVLALRVVGTYRKDGGYIDNVSPTLNQKNYNDDASWLLRGTLLYKPSEVLDVAVKYMHRTAQVYGLNATPADSPLVADYLVEPRSNDSLNIVNGVVNFHIAGATLTSSTSYLDRHALAVRDLTPLGQAYIAAVTAAAAAAPPIALNNKNDYHQISQELRIASDDTGRLKYVAGLYFAKLTKEFIQDGAWPGLQGFLEQNGTPAALDGKGPVASPVLGITDWNFYLANVSQDLRQLAAFGELTWSILEPLDLTVGGREFNIKQHFLFDANPQSLFVTPDADYRKSELTDVGFNPKATLSYRALENLLVYATAAKGFRPGGFNQPVSTNLQCLQDFASLGYNPNSVAGFKADSIWSYEAGVKAKTPDRRAEINGAVYQENWSDIQLRNPLTCGFTVFDTASKARIRGVEGALNVRVTNGLLLELNGTYTNARLLSASPTTGAVAGEHLLGIPDFTLGSALEYDFAVPGGLDAYARVESNYISSYDSYFSHELYAGSPQNRSLGAYGLTNLRVGLANSSGTWSAQLFVNNVFNRLGETGAQNDIFGDVRFRTRPLEVGVQASHKFP